MAFTLTFDEYNGKYKRIINTIEIDEAMANGYYCNATSLDEPISFDDEDPSLLNTIYINNEYFSSNHDEIMSLIIDTINQTTKNTFQISYDDFVTKDVLDAIILNSRIKNVSILPIKGLNKNDVYTLLNSNIKTINCTINYEDYPDLLNEDFEGINIVNYPTIGGVSIADFYHNHVNLIIDYELANEELSRLRYLFQKYPQEIIRIEFEKEEQMDEILSYVNSKFISIKNNDNWNNEKYKYFEDNYNNIMIEVQGELGDDIFVSPNTLIEKNKIINGIIKEVRDVNLSPLEQYMYLYNIVKMFKEYKEVPDNENDRLSRDIMHILFNEYMVCVGYVLLLEELVDKLDNPNISLTRYSCYIEDDAVIFGHRKALVKIDDEKYDVHGVYISDPTWDSVEYYKKTNIDDEVKYDFSNSIAHYDYYNHFLMTKDEATDEDIEYASADVSDLLFKYVAESCKINSDEDTNKRADTTIKFLCNKPHMTREMIDSEIKKIQQHPQRIRQSN